MDDRELVALDDVGQDQVLLVGGKAANLGELRRIRGVRVPGGFCVTTVAFDRYVHAATAVGALLQELEGLRPDDSEAIHRLGARLRAAVEAVAVPPDLTAAIEAALAAFGDDAAVAVRSSATVEDSPSASFAGQHDTYLDVVGGPAVLAHVRRCWASLFTERAIAYRLRNGIGRQRASMAVVVQQMVAADTSGVLFTADPATSNRKVCVIEAGSGLGEALVSGHVSPDTYRVRDGEIVAHSAGTEGPVVGEAQVLRLAELGRRIEAHFGVPQDIEWCLAGEEISVVQSRPITTLFPIPSMGDEGYHVYVSVGHQQMMTDPMRPLGLSFWLMTTPAPMTEAAGRLFVDVTARLRSSVAREAVLDALGRSDPLIGDALRAIVGRGDVAAVPEASPAASSAVQATSPPEPIETDPAIVEELIAACEASIAALQQEIIGKSGVELLDFIAADIGELRRVLFDPRGHEVFMSAMEASWWLNDRLYEWLGVRNAADALSQSVPHNVTSEMGLALLDVADVIRPLQPVVKFLEGVAGGSLDGLEEVTGGLAARAAIDGFLDAYGARCAGEIDITRERWRERPAALVPLILSNVRNFAPGEAMRRFERGREEAARAERELLGMLRALPDGESKAAETKRKIDRVRTFIGFREFPKFGMVRRYFVYKAALLRDAERLVSDGVIAQADDVFYLSFAELHAAVASGWADRELIAQRREAFHSYQALTPPRVITSDGEVVTGSYGRADVPDGALVGLAVSAGTVEGRARVLTQLAGAEIEPGDILVTTSTDPSWSILFVSVRGVVTEVGGLMTHGAVIAREYGLPAVVGVEHATRLIRDGQPIRVNGTDGYVELLGELSGRGGSGGASARC